MIILENSEEAINGLAKIICQNPTLSIKLRNIKNKLLEEKVIKDNTDYFNKQEEILRKAEEKGLSSTGYIFELFIDEESPDKEKNYMVYKNIGNEMVPIREEFKIAPSNSIHFEGLIGYLNSFNIHNLITFEPSFQDCFYSFPWFEKGETELYDTWGHSAQHSSARFDRDELIKLQENNILFQSISQKEAWEFNLHLKDLTQY